MVALFTSLYVLCTLLASFLLSLGEDRSPGAQSGQPVLEADRELDRRTRFLVDSEESRGSPSTCSKSATEAACPHQGERRGRMAVRTILGTGEFGKKTDQEESLKITKYFLAAGHHELDTAFMYGGGKSEETIGKIFQHADVPKFSVGTKANPWNDEGLQPRSVKRLFAISLERLRAKSVDIFYLHAPDHKTPIEETLAAVQELYEEGKFKEFGVSNYAAWQVVEIYYICKAKGYVLPTVYQGMYNAFTRNVERELLPALHHLGMRFYAYNPLACGLMTGKYKYEDNETTVGAGRFFGDKWGEVYRNRYWKKCYFDGLDIIREALKATGCSDVPVAEACLRWLYHHSCLSPKFDDGVVLGASTMAHLTANMAATEKGPLEPSVVEAFEKAWQLTKPECEQYFR